MIKKFKARPGFFDTIEEVTVERETESSVWINGRRSAKRSSYDNYFDTWREAHECILLIAKKKLRSAKMRVSAAEDRLAKIDSMVEPK